MSNQFSKKKALESARTLMCSHESVSHDIDDVGIKTLFDTLLSYYGVPSNFNSKQSIATMFFTIAAQSGKIDVDVVLSILATVHRMRKRVGDNKKKRKDKTGLVHKLVTGNSSSQSFYTSSEWQQARYKAFDLHGNYCQCCGRHPTDGIVLHVDHIIPRVLKPELALDADNLQILCELCNMGKRADYITDWRQS